MELFDSKPIVFLRNKKFAFSGHESFQCRNLWLKKGYDFVKAGRSFNDDDAVVELGVGKNMVNSIRYWMKSFNLLTSSDTLTQLANKLLSDDGWDPYLEDEATLWLLHYHLVTTGYATAYDLLFNELRRDRVEFTRDNFLSFIKRKAETLNTSVNENTIISDFGVFVKMYIRSESQVKDREEGFSGLLTELDLVRKLSRNKEEYYVIQNTEKRELPHEIVLYGILEGGQFSASVNFNTLLTEPDQVGSVFGLNATGLYSKLESIVNEYSDIIFSDQAGIRELSFKSKPEPFTVLAQYYGK